MSVVGEIRDILVADATILAAVATYEGLPAVISPAPIAEIECPYIALVEVGSARDGAENRCSRAYQQLVEVHVIDDRSGSLAQAREIAQAAWLALDRASINDGTIMGYLDCDGVSAMADDDGFPGLRLSVVAHVWEG